MGFGAAGLWMAPRADRETRLLRAWAATLFAAGVARAISWIDVGRPDDLFVGLLVAELALPPIIIAWQARMRRGSGALSRGGRS